MTLLGQVPFDEWASRRKEKKMKYTCREADFRDGPLVPGAWIVEIEREWVAITPTEADARMIVRCLLGPFKCTCDDCI